MNRILSTTAITALLLSGAAYAQDDATEEESAVEQSETEGSMSESTSMEAEGEAMPATGSGEIFAQVPADQDLQFGSDLIGMTIYTMMTEQPAEEGDMAATEESTEETVATEESEAEADTGAEAEAAPEDQRQSIGEINDLIITQEGTVDYVVLGVGGFLGIGERNVAINMDALTFNPPMEEGGDEYITIEATQQQIENAPEFDRAALEEGEDPMAAGEEEAAEEEAAAAESEAEMGDAAEETEAAAEEAGNEAEEAEQAAEEAGQEAEQAAEEAGNEAEQAAEEAGNEAEQAAEEAGDAAEEAEQEAEEATSGN